MDAVARINPTIPDDAQQEAIKEISRIHSPELLTNNETGIFIGSIFKLNHHQRQAIDKHHHIRAFIHAVFNDR
jgi:hypothetical protein